MQNTNGEHIWRKENCTGAFSVFFFLPSFPLLLTNGEFVSDSLALFGMLFEP